MKRDNNTRIVLMFIVLTLKQHKDKHVYNTVKMKTAFPTYNFD